MLEIVQKFLSDHAGMALILVIVNAVFSGLAICLSKLTAGGVSVPAWLVKVVDFVSANIEHK